MIRRDNRTRPVHEAFLRGKGALQTRSEFSEYSGVQLEADFYFIDSAYYGCGEVVEFHVRSVIP